MSTTVTVSQPGPMGGPRPVAGRVGLGDAIRHTLTVMRRNLLHIRSDPEQMVGMTIMPLMFLMLFV
jgi:oleandomycin transport system permease protein